VNTTGTGRGLVEGIEAAISGATINQLLIVDFGLRIQEAQSEALNRVTWQQALVYR
jgi:hypothetical protein